MNEVAQEYSGGSALTFENIYSKICAIAACTMASAKAELNGRYDIGYDVEKFEYDHIVPLRRYIKIEIYAVCDKLRRSGLGYSEALIHKLRRKGREVGPFVFKHYTDQIELKKLEDLDILIPNYLTMFIAAAGMRYVQTSNSESSEKTA